MCRLTFYVFNWDESVKFMTHSYHTHISEIMMLMAKVHVKVQQQLWQQALNEPNEAKARKTACLIRAIYEMSLLSQNSPKYELETAFDPKVSEKKLRRCVSVNVRALFDNTDSGLAGMCIHPVILARQTVTHMKISVLSQISKK